MYRDGECRVRDSRRRQGASGSTVGRTIIMNKTNYCINLFLHSGAVRESSSVE
jgi:hypothetical protein